MKIIFISNYMTHHQLPFCKRLYEKFGSDFCFIATTPIEQERSNMGFADLNKEFDYIIRTYDGTEEKVDSKIMKADVVIFGDAPMSYIKQRLKNNKLTFRYSERIYKQGYQSWKYPIRRIKHYWKFSRHKNYYLLCASAYAAGDYAKTGMFVNKAYRWGYFPEVKEYENVDRLIKAKEPASILWVARLIELKHPEAAIEVAQRLKEDGYHFKLSMIGSGPMQEQLEQMIKSKNIEDCVELLGVMSPEEVRKHMERSEIFLFNSDRHEGWGAVMNESMNSGCAVVASHIVGSVPFLIQEGENGLIYKSGDTDDLYRKVKLLLDDPQKRREMGKAAYETVAQQWNADNATERFVELVQVIQNGTECPDLFADGVCSKAPPLSDDWYK